MSTGQAVIKPSQSILDRLLIKVLPARFLTGEDAFRAKVLWLYSTSLGGLGSLILAGLTLAEGTVPGRRLVTVILAALLLGVTVLMRYATHLTSISAYVLLITISTVFYVDFNNLSIEGPSTVLWIVPFTLMALLFSSVRLFAIFCCTFSLFILNVVALHKGWLPEPIIKPENWLYAQCMYVLLAVVMVVICTRGMSGIASDNLLELNKEINNKQKHIEQINQLKVIAESSTQSKSMFLSTMSHELRTPLNSVIGNAQLLSRADLPDKYRVQARDIATAGNLLLILINDILDFSNIEESQLNLIEKSYDINRQIIELTRMMESRLKPSVKINLTLPHKTSYIYADENRLSQVIMNLLSNSIKFTEQGEIKVSLEVENNKDIKISIADTGIGIKPDDIKKLFTRFTQVTDDSAKNMEGAGLGLAISLGIIKQMNGDIKVNSTIGKGSCFTVILPDRLTERPTIDNSANQGRLDTSYIKNCSILVVDDIEMNCVVLESMLLDLGAQKIKSVNSGRLALEYITQNMQTQIIFMDMRMPEMNGVEATQAIQKLGYKGKIFAVTANASTQDNEICIAAGMDDFISKPVDMIELERILLKSTNK
ncbi:MAG: signal transduction histidine kinase/CheY-like chemotaxis protein [Psychrobacter glaciei]